MQENQRLSYYIKESKLIDVSKYGKKIKVSVLGSFTLNGIEETLRVKCSEIDVGCITYVSGYNQYNQEILNNESQLYKFCPDITFLILDTRNMLENSFYSIYDLTESERRKIIEKKLDEVLQLIKVFTKNSNSKLIITNLAIPRYSSYGIYEMKVNYGLMEMVMDFDLKLNEQIREIESVYVYDFDGFVRKYGEINTFDFKQFLIGDIKISFDYIPHLIDDLIGFIKPILGLNKKCIVLDLDNTLWGGIIGEDGLEGIRLGDTPEGKAFVEFQEILLGLNQRGIILAINSKNNYDDAIKVIHEHPNMILKEENFSRLKINWDDKVENMKAIASELNIGLDSIVFFDDDPMNIEYMQMNLPQVLTIRLSEDPSQYAQKLMSMNDFDVLKITNEDKNRRKMYLEEKQRKDFESYETNLDDFLKKLNIKLIFKSANSFTIPRISQLTLKTNQFNLTTKRYQEEEIKNMLLNKNYWIRCVQVKDKFGDSGITGVFIIKKEESEWVIDSFLLSCRIMGRKIEDGILSYIVQKAKENNIDLIKGKFIPTQKNKPCETFLEDFGFMKENSFWTYKTNSTLKTPEHLSIIEEK